jgi:hypothetical protein
MINGDKKLSTAFMSSAIGATSRTKAALDFLFCSVLMAGFVQWAG